MSILKSLLVIAYLILLIIGFLALGVFNRRSKWLSSKPMLMLIFFMNNLIPFAGFGFSIFVTILVNIVGIVAYWLGIKMKVIGLTGGIASGKSTVSKLLKEEGFIIIDADVISINMRKHDKNYQSILRVEFGESVWDESK